MHVKQFTMTDTNLRSPNLIDWCYLSDANLLDADISLLVIIKIAKS